MTEKSNALARAQLLMLHADTIENDSIKNMVIDSATELAVLHDEIERLREALAWAYNLRHLRGHSDPVVIPERFAPFIEAALRRDASAAPAAAAVDASKEPEDKA